MVGVAKMVGLLAQSFGQGWGCKVLGEVDEGLAWIGHVGGWEQGSWMMGSRWWWPWGSFSQSERCEMVAGGGDKMVGPLGHSSGHGRGYEMVGCLAHPFSWGGGCKIAVGGSDEGMGGGGCGWTWAIDETILLLLLPNCLIPPPFLHLGSSCLFSWPVGLR